MASKRIMRYKCPYCEKRMERKPLVIHVEDKHDDMIPEGYTAFRVVFNYINKKPLDYNGKCTECGGPTRWDEEKGRYDRQCSNPKCKESYLKKFEENMMRTRGVTRMSQTAEGQKQMLANRKISGTYKFQDGGVKTYTGSYELKALEFMDKILEIKSDDILAPGPILEYSYQGKTHIYITDFYYQPYNLIIEVKDGGNNPNKRDMPEYRAKQIAKEQYIIKHTNYNYLRLTNNDFGQLMTVFADLKYEMQENTGERVIHVNEDTDLDIEILSEISRQDINSKYLEKGDICYNLDKWPDEYNILFITGISGSGKTTLGIDMTKEFNCNRVELDYISAYYLKKCKERNAYNKFRSLLSKECPEAVEFLDLNPVEKYGMKEKWSDTTNILQDFCDWFTSKVLHNGKSYIVNGAFLVDMDHNFFYDKPLILKDINYIKTVFRRTWREFIESDKSFFDKISSSYHALKTGLSKEYRAANKKFKDYRNDMNNNAELKESYVEERVAPRGEVIKGYNESVDEILSERSLKADPVTLYHGSHHNIKNYIAPKNDSYEDNNYVFATTDRLFALCFAGNPWYDDILRQSYYNGKLTLTEEKPGFLNKIFDTDGYIYTIDNSDIKKFTQRKRVIFTSTEKVKYSNKEYIPNVLEELENSNIEIYKYPDKPSWYYNKKYVNESKDVSVFDEGFFKSQTISKNEIFKNANIIRDKITEFIKNENYNKYISVVYKDRLVSMTSSKYRNIYIIDLLRFKKDKWLKDKANGDDTVYRLATTHKEADQYFNNIKDKVLKKLKNIPEFKIFENNLFYNTSLNSTGYDSSNYDLGIKRAIVADKIVESTSQYNNYIFLDVQSNKSKVLKYLKDNNQTQKYAQDVIDNYNGEIIVTDNKMIGRVFVGDKKDKGFITDFSIDKEYRGNKLGSRLIDDAISKYNGYDLLVDKDNKLAIDMYTKRGFVIYKTVKNQYWMKLINANESVDEIISERSLKGNPVVLYHGSIDGTYDKILANSYNAGKKWEAARMSSFWFIKKEYAIMFATAELLQKVAKETIGPNKIFILIDNDMKTLVDEKYRDIAEEIIKTNKCYVYSKTIDPKYISGGQGRNFPEYTLGFDVKPDNVYTCTKSDMSKSIKYVSKEYILDTIEKYKKDKMTFGNGLFGQMIDNIIYPSFKDVRIARKTIKSYNESVLFESKTNKKYYHVSQSNLNGKTLQPSVPNNYFTKNGYEDNKTKRVCFTNSIDNCLRALSQKCNNMELYVHILDGNYDVYTPSVDEVPDCKVTGEVWVTKPCKVKCIGKIKVIGDRGEDGLPFKYGNKTAELYDWDWEWIEQLSESKDVSTLTDGFKKKSEFHFRLVDINSEEALKYITPEWRNGKDGRLGICIEDNYLAGYIYWRSSVGTIGPIRVYDHYKENGLGETLLREAIKNGGYKLGVYTDNQVAISLYKKLGFVEVGRKTYKDGDEVIMMELQSKINESSLTEAKIITVNESAGKIYYRVTCNGEGIYEALKKAIGHDEWIKLLNDKAINWLPKPPKYNAGYESYFTKEGYHKFNKYTLPIILKYIDEDFIDVKKYTDSGYIVYRDKYQVVTSQPLLPVQEAYKEISDEAIDEAFNIFDFIIKKSNLSNNIKYTTANNKTQANTFENLGGALFNQVKLDHNNKQFIIKGINFEKFLLRLKEMYQYRGITKLFEKKYSNFELKLWKLGLKSKNSMKVRELNIPLYFALEMYNIFTALGDFYNLDFYKNIAKNIYRKTWVSNFEDRTDYKKLDTNIINNIFNSEYKLKDYQKTFIEEYGNFKYIYDLVGYILCFEQGLGKTLTSLALAETLKKDQIIIICPNSLKENWVNEIGSYYKIYNNKSLLVKDVYAHGVSRFTSSKNPKFIIVNQESIDKISNIVKKGKNSIIIVDEIHNFRNIDSNRSKALINLKESIDCKDNLLMSGTPIKANATEIIPMLRMIDPYFTEELANIYKKAFNNNTIEVSDVVKTRFSRIIYRKTKDEVLSLPNKTISNLELPCKNSSKYISSVIKAEIVKEIKAQIESRKDSINKYKKIFEEMVLLYSAASYKETKDYLKYIAAIGSEYVDEDEADYQAIIYKNFLKTNVYPNITDKSELKKFDEARTNYVYFKQSCIGKAIGKILPPANTECYKDIFDDNINVFIDYINKSTKKTVIFTPFLEVANYVNDELNKKGIGSVKIVGNVSNRMDIINKFKFDDSIDVLVATVQTLSTGVTLTEADQMFFLGVPYRKADFDQACDRIHRIGQTKDVSIYVVLLKTKEANITNRLSDIMNNSGESSDALIYFENADINTTNSIVLNEGVIRNEPDVMYNKKLFDAGDINLCFVTGHSGSGKSTFAYNYTKNHPNTEVYELDDLIANYRFTDEEFKEYGDLIYSFFKKYSKYRIPQGVVSEDKLNEWSKNNGFNHRWEYYKELTNKFVEYSKSYAKIHSKKYIVEGIQLFCFCEPKIFDNYAFYIKGTSATLSWIRSLKRDIKTEGIKAIKFKWMQIKDYGFYEKQLYKFRDYFAPKCRDKGYGEDSMSEAAFNELMSAIGYAPVVGIEKSDAYIVNYMSNKVFSGEPSEGVKRDAIGVTNTRDLHDVVGLDDEQKLKRLKLEEVHNPILYKIGMTNEQVSDILYSSLDTVVDENFIYESLTNQTVYGDVESQAKATLEAVSVVDMEKKINKICENYLLPPDDIEIALSDLEAQVANMRMDIYNE